MMRIGAVAVFAGAFCLGLGCEGKNDPNFQGVEITGTVLLDGKPVEAGLVTAALAEDLGKSSTGQLGPGGKFTIVNCPTGQVAFSVNTKAALSAARADEKFSKGKEKHKVIDVPTKYLDAKNAGLLETVTGRQNVTLKLTAK